MNPSLAERLELIIPYFKTRKEHGHIEYCKRQPNLSNALYAAAASTDGEKMYSHQWRVGEKVLTAYGEKLQEVIDDIRQAKNFDQLYEIIEKVDMQRVGELTQYDVAERIAQFLQYEDDSRDMLPKVIYLHAGVEDGAKALGIDIRGKKTLRMEDLPHEFLGYGLMPYDLENILCLYKDCFGASLSNWQKALEKHHGFVQNQKAKPVC